MKTENAEEWLDENVPPIIKYPLIIVAIPFAIVFFAIVWLFLPPRFSRDWFGIGADSQGRKW